MTDDLDLAMQARMAREDSARFRSALTEAVFNNATRPSDDTLIAFACSAIRHAKQMSPENPHGLPCPSSAYIDVMASELVAHGDLNALEARRLAEIQYDTLARIGVVHPQPQAVD